MKLGSLFDGSGGFPLAGEINGITPVWASEVEPYPIAVTRSRFPAMNHLGDVSAVDGSTIQPVDIITFGSPCQDMSIAGKRAGIKNQSVGDDETTRSGLFHEAARIIREMREATNGAYPSFAVWENVPGAFSSNKGEDFRCVLETLVQIVEPGAVMPPVPKGGWAYADHYCGDGWSLAYRTFDAQYWGVPQRRRRIYLVLDLRGQRAGKILFEPEGVRGDSSSSGTEGKGTSSDAQRGTGVCDRAVPYLLKIRSGCDGGGKGPLLQEDKSATLATNNDQYLFVPMVSAGFKGGAGEGSGSIGYEKEKAPTIVSGMTADIVVKECMPFDTTQVTSPQNGCNPKWGDSCHPLATTGHAPAMICKCWDARGNGDGEIASTITGDHENRITDYSTVVCLQGNTVDRNAHQNGSGVNENISFTINSTDRHAIVYRMSRFGEYLTDGSASTLKQRDYKSANDLVCVRYAVRRLTPTECARLQGFPDRWGDIEPLDISDEHEVDRWRHIYKTYCIISGLKINRSLLERPDSLKKWHDKLHTDSAEYKMWGNGIALPNAVFVLSGIAKMLRVQLLIEQLTGGADG